MKIPLPKIKHLNMRMTIYFSTAMVTALIIIVISISQTFSDKLIAEMNVVINQKINLITAILNSTLDEIKALQFSVINDKNINAFMRTQAIAGGLDKNSLETLQQDLSYYKQRHTIVTSIFVIGNNDKILDPLYSVNAFKWITGTNDFVTLKKTKSLGVFSSPNPFPLTTYKPNSFENDNITYFGQYYDYSDYKYLGYVAVNLRRNSIFSEIDPLSKETFDFSCIINSNNEIVQIFGDNTSQSFLTVQNYLKDRNQVVKVDGNNYLLYTQSIKSNPKWTFVGLIKYQQITSKLMQIYKTVFFVSILVLLMVIFISFYIASRITFPIKKLSKSMDLLGKGIWPEEIKSRTDDEIKDLVLGFNKLVVDIQNLTEDILDEQDEKKKFELSMLKFQLESLQSQINPHFIHNTLNTMNYMAKKAGATELEETITAFNSLLRSSISQTNSFITAIEEVDNLKNYINIQKHRYDINIDFTCEVDDDARYALLPKLLLQPLVENSLFHGIVPKRGGKIIVSIRKENNFVHLCVEDDGAGMKEEEMQLVLEGKTPNPKGFSSMGLSNVNERLALYYSSESRLKIVSSPNNGTKIYFSIPFNA